MRKQTFAMKVEDKISVGVLLVAIATSITPVTLGILVVVFYLSHAVVNILDGTPANLLWACHIGALMVGIGLLLRNSWINAIGVLWLCLGNGMWILYLIGGGDFFFTSALTHVGGLVIGLVGIDYMGIPRFSWLWALILLFGLQHLCRMVTPEHENVNLAFRIHEGWERIFPSYSVYIIFLTTVACAVFVIVEVVLRAWKRK